MWAGFFSAGVLLLRPVSATTNYLQHDARVSPTGSWPYHLFNENIVYPCTHSHVRVRLSVVAV